ncbi:MAG: hypothetical protein JO336_10820, partial [Acidobacteriia bacterium]|nr:hypothetical protein [Terriglobia bacterium]
LPWVAKGDARYLPFTAALLGVAVLAKGLVPLVLALPLAAVVALKRGPRALGALLQWRVAVPFLIVALPWYVLCTIRNGREFLRVFFWQHQFERLHSPALQHIQPFWFYVPILFVGLLPWAPLAALGFRPQHWREPRRAFLLAWVLFGFVFFSLAVNKLPGYMLPLLPAICAVMGVGMAEASNTGVSLGLAASALLLAIFPVGSRLLPAALAQGLSRAPAAHLGWSWAAAVAAAILVVLLARRDRTFEAFTFLALCAAASLLYVKAAALPEIDRVASARSLWRQIAAKREETCVATLNRNFRYGLNYYSGVPLPDCTEQPEPLEIRQQPGEAPQIDRSSAMLAQPAPSR